nr:MAG TPA_asm: hypothetical protein [Caudoviricetes sp.]
MGTVRKKNYCCRKTCIARYINFFTGMCDRWRRWQ